MASEAHTMSPLRRHLLSGLAAAPVAFLPVTLGAVHPADAAVAAKARDVRAALAAAKVAIDRFNALDDEASAKWGAPPILDRAALNQQCIAVLMAFADVTPEVDAAIAQKRRDVEARFAKERDRWAEAKESWCVASGYGEVEATYLRLLKESDDLLRELGAMPIASMAGAMAKVSALRAFALDHGDEVHAEIACAIVRDLVQHAEAA